MKVLSQKPDTLLDSCNSFNAAVDYIFSYIRTKLGHNNFKFDTFMLPRQYAVSDVFVTEVETKYSGKKHIVYKIRKKRKEIKKNIRYDKIRFSLSRQV